MRLPAAIVLATLIATPALAIDIVSGSGAAVKNGHGLTVVNGEPCVGEMQAACLSREDDRRETFGEPVAAAAVPQEPLERMEYEYDYSCDSAQCE